MRGKEEGAGVGRGVRGFARRLRMGTQESVVLTETLPVRGGATARARGGGLTADGRLRSGRLAGLSMWRAVWVLAWPITLESFLNSLVGLTDTKLAAGLGVAETDAIGGASYIMWFIGLVVMALGIGATALIARSIGRGRFGVANAVLGQSATLAVVAGIGVGAFVMVAGSVITWLLNMTPEAGEAFDRYIVVIAAGTPAASMIFVLAACARGAGDAKRPLIVMTVRNIVNMGVSYALSGVDIWGVQNPFTFDLGVTGIALGTVTGDVVAAGVIVWMAAGGAWGIRLKARWLKPHWHTIRRLVRLGLPNFFESLGMWVGNFLVMVMVGWLGVEALARHEPGGQLGTHIIAVRIESFSFLPGFALGTAAATLAGQFLGAGSERLARRAVVRCTMVGALVMGGLGVAFVMAPEWIVSLLSDQPEHLVTTPDLLVVCGSIQVPFAVTIIVRGALRGAGDVKVVMWLTWVATYLIRLPLAYLLSGVDIPLGNGHFIVNPSPVDWGLVGLWIALCGEVSLRSLIFVARFLQGGWARVKV
ncbi:MAG: MATE family efflux transporter [Phycisphaerales bacterium]